MSTAPEHRYPPVLQTLLNDIERAHSQGYAQELLIELADEFVEVPASVATRPFSKEHLVPHC